jgi:CheY-like chemotaxis protein
MAALVVLVNADRSTLKLTETILSRVGYRVVAVPSFGEASRMLDTLTPDLLVADIRLDAFNGLELAIRCRLEHPHVVVVVTNVTADPTLKAEAARHGVEFLVAPPDDPEFLRRLESALQERRDQQTRVRRWDRKHVGGTLHVKVADERARVLDMSYGGVRLAFRDEAHIPMRFEIELPSSSVPVKAHRVWTAPVSTDQFWCGVELDEATTHWREFVNSAAGFGR